MEKIPPHHDTPPLDLKNLNLDKIKTGNELKEAGQAAKVECKQVLEEYVKDFCRGGLEGTHGVQGVGQKGWTTIPSTLLRKKIAAHLWGDYAVGVRAPWYPAYCAIDVDKPRRDIIATVDEVKEKLELEDSQVAVYTSPSYYKESCDHSRSVHIFIKPLYMDNPPTLRLQRRILFPLVKELGYELYLQAGRVFRLPFGRNQNYIDQKNGFVEEEWSWQAAFRKFQELVPAALETFPFQRPIEPSYSCDYHPDNSPQRKEAEELLETGLTEFGTRHMKTGLLARYFYFQNVYPKEAEVRILFFLETKHNGKSKEINSGNWDLVKKEIHDWVERTYSYFGSQKIYPDGTHNLLGWATKRDVEQIIQVFPGDYINQGRFFKLISYYRPRQRQGNGFVPIHRERWRKLIGNRGEREFKALLVDKNLIEINPSFRVGRYSKAYRLNSLSSAKSDDMIKDEDGRAIQNYKKALWHSFGQAKNIIDATGIPKRTLYD